MNCIVFGNQRCIIILIKFLLYVAYSCINEGGFMVRIMTEAGVFKKMANPNVFLYTLKEAVFI